MSNRNNNGGAQSYKHAMDVGKILLNALGELKDIRRSLNGEVENIDSTFQLDNVLSLAEHSLRDKAEQLSEVIMRQEEGGDADGGTLVTNKQPKAPRSPRRRGQKDYVTNKHGQGSADWSRLVDKPTTDKGRDYLAERFDIAKPSSGANARTSGKLGGEQQPLALPRSAITIKAGTILPKEVREDPYAEPPPLQEADIKHGVFNLINRGLLPEHVDMTATLAHGGSAVQAGASRLHDPHDAHSRMDVSTGANMPGYTLANVKLDLLGPPPPPTLGSPTGASSSRKVMNIKVDELGGLAPEDLDELLGSPLAPDGGGKPPLYPLYGEDPVAAAGRYEDLLDEYSLHEFLIRRGQTLTSTPEYDSYKRAFIDLWPDIEVLIRQLEDVCATYMVPLAVIDGKKLGQMAAMIRQQRASYKLPMATLLESVTNIDAVSKLIEQPGRKFYGTKGQDEAAMMIQSRYRGHAVRQKAKNDELSKTYVVPLQRWWRTVLLRKATAAALKRKKETDRAAFAALQDHLKADWDSIQEGPRVLIHLPSISTAADHRLSMPHYQMRQNSQMARLCALSDTNVDIVYVSPYPLPEDIAGYYEKLLQVGGVQDPEQRYRIVVPENHHRLPSHLSLARLLYYSPYALKRIQAMVKGRPAYIVPAHVGEDELALAVKLNMPLLAPHPDHSPELATKSVARGIFKEAEVNVAPGVEVPVGGRFISSNPLTVQYELEAMEDQGKREDVLATLATLVVEHPHVPRWIMKLDHEHGGRGHAWIDVGTIRSLEPVLERLKQLQRPPPLARQREAVGAVEAGLRRSMPRRVGIAGAALYPSWPDYASAMIRQGGVIEACPAMVTGSPSVNLLIAPTGLVTVLSTHEQIFCPAYRFIGASFPQSSVPHAALAQASEVVGQCCWKAGVIGHVGIDFVALKEAGMLRLWAVDLNIRYTATQASFDMFHFVCGGRFDALGGSYLVPELLEEEEEEAGAPEDTSELAAQDHLQETQEEGKEMQEGSMIEGSEAGGGMGDDESMTSNLKAGRSLRSGEGRAMEDVQWERRFYVMNDVISHSNLSAIQYAAFFNRCRLDGVCFDMQERVGTAFNLIDSFAAGVLGILCVGHSPQEAFRELAGALDFISRQVGPSDSDDSPAALERNNFRSVHSTMKYLADKLSSHAPRPAEP